MRKRKQKVKVKISKEPFVFAPVEKGKIIGTAYFYIENELVAKTPLLAEFFYFYANISFMFFLFLYISSSARLNTSVNSVSFVESNIEKP